MDFNDADQSPDGYGNPPRSGQFTPGQSGNARGRPKGTPNKKTILRAIAAEKHEITVQGERRRVSIAELLFIRLRELAMKGDEKALQAQNDWLSRLEAEREAEWTFGLVLGEGYYGPEDTPLQVERVKGGPT